MLSFLFTPFSISKGNSTPSPRVEECERTDYWETYKGSIGPYKVEIHHEYTFKKNAIWEGLSYRYTSIRVNKGKWIDCDHAGSSGDYSIWKEKINGRHTGTFRIKIREETKSGVLAIIGTFTNSKGQTYKVFATLEEGWGEDGAYGPRGYLLMVKNIVKAIKIIESSC